MRQLILSLAFLCVQAATAFAACEGRNLFETLPAQTRAQINTAVAQTPFREGLLWQAKKGDQSVTIVGTFHFADPRHQKLLQRLKAPLKDADRLLVEAGPDEEKRLKLALMQDPSLTVVQDGPTLPERLSPRDWEILSAAMTERGMPAIVTAKLQPWYVAMLVGVSPCMITDAAAGVGGLDQLLVQSAQQADLPISALEPWDTVFSLFEGLTDEQELDMIRSSLPAAIYADDYAVTVADAYFEQDVWRIWEFGRYDAYANSGLSKADVDSQMDIVQSRLLDGRNRNWIAPLIQAARAAADKGKGIVAAVGALHLPGENGVLNLLAQQGWAIERLE